MFSGVYRNQPSVCVQNTSFCQRAGGGVKSHLVTALVFIVQGESGFFANISANTSSNLVRNLKSYPHLPLSVMQTVANMNKEQNKQTK